MVVSDPPSPGFVQPGQDFVDKNAVADVRADGYLRWIQVTQNRPMFKVSRQT